MDRQGGLLSKGYWSRWIGFGFLLLCAAPVPGQAGEDRNQELERQFQAAAAAYSAGQFAQASAQLEGILPKAPDTFEIHELLGLAYAAQNQMPKAVEQLEIAVRLKPNAAAARTNLATALVHSGQPARAEEQFRKALALEPEDYSANRNLGEFFVQSGKLAEAIPLLAKAQEIRPSYENGYDLALACFLAGRLDQARAAAQSLLAQKNTGELHNLLAQIDEKEGKYLDAANEFEAAAHMDPTESNLFDWGSELLLHRTYEPAIDIFEQGTKRYPSSQRMFIGLGMSLYARGKYGDAVQALLTAVDLNPSDPRCYLFLSNANDSSPDRAEDVAERFRRYAELQPNNAMAKYYYAMSLWKGRRAQDGADNLQQVESLLQQAAALDPKLTEAHLQLGNLYAERRDYAKSIPEYEKALKLNPNLPDAHYRLGMDYVHSGQKDRAQQEFDVYQRLRAQHHAEEDKQGLAVQQFVYSERAAQPASQ